MVEICGESSSGKSVTLMYALANALIQSNTLPSSFLFGPPSPSSSGSSSSTSTIPSKAGNSYYTTTYRIILIDLEFRFQISLFIRILLATLQEYSLKSSSSFTVPLSNLSSSSSSSSFFSSSAVSSSSAAVVQVPPLTTTNISSILQYYLQKLEIYRPRTSREFALTFEYLSTQSKYVPVINENSTGPSSENSIYRGNIAFIGIDGFGSSWLWQDRVGIPGMDKDIILAHRAQSTVTSTIQHPQSSSPSSTGTINHNPPPNLYTHTSSLGLNHDQDYQRISFAIQHTILKHRCRILWTRSFMFGSNTAVYQSSNIDLSVLTHQYNRMHQIGQTMVSRTLSTMNTGSALVLNSTVSTVSTDITVDDLSSAYRDYLPKCLSQLVKYTILMNKLNYVDTQYIFSSSGKLNNGLAANHASPVPLNLFDLSSLKSHLQQIGGDTNNSMDEAEMKHHLTTPSTTHKNISIFPQSLSIFIARLRTSTLPKASSSSSVITSIPRNGIPYFVKECTILYSLFTAPLLSDDTIGVPPPSSSG